MKVSNKNFDFSLAKFKGIIDNFDAQKTKEKKTDSSADAQTNTEPQKFRCPYCQHKIKLEDVLFRAYKPSSEKEVKELEEKIQKINDSRMSGEIEDDSEINIDELNDELLIKKQYMAVEDKRLKEFWFDEKGWNSEDESLIEFSWGYGELSKNGTYDKRLGTKVSEVTSYLLKNEQILSYERDNDGYILSVTDKRNKKSSIKVCPDCHCILPENFGRQEMFFVSFVGTKGSGKTVFLSKLLEEMRTIFSKDFGLHVRRTDSMKWFTDQKKVQAGKPLPDSTSTSFKPPVFVEISKGTSSYYTLVMYDIAGENCTQSSDMSRIGDFIKNAHAIIMLIAPEQINRINLCEDDKREVEHEDIIEVVITLAETYAEEKLRQSKKQCNANMAVVLSQSDVYQHSTIFDETTNSDEKIITSEANIYRDVQYLNNTKGYMVASHKNVDGEVRKIIAGTDLEIEVRRYYKNVDYFAVSVLGSRPIKTQDPDNPDKKIYVAPDTQPIRLEESMAWALYKLGVIDAVNDK